MPKQMNDSIVIFLFILGNKTKKKPYIAACLQSGIYMSILLLLFFSVTQTDVKAGGTLDSSVQAASLTYESHCIINGTAQHVGIGPLQGRHV